MSQPTLPAIIGPTENALRALLVRTLAGTRIDGYREWSALVMIAGGAPIPALAAGLQISEQEVGAIIDRLRGRDLLLDSSTLTAGGRSELDGVRTKVASITAGLTAGISEEHEAICRDVLTTITARAWSELAVHHAERQNLTAAEAG